MIYFDTMDRAQALADTFNFNSTGHVYRVRASRAGFFVAIFDHDFNFVGAL